MAWHRQEEHQRHGAKRPRCSSATPLNQIYKKKRRARCSVGRRRVQKQESTRLGHPFCPTGKKGTARGLRRTPLRELAASPIRHIRYRTRQNPSGGHRPLAPVIKTNASYNQTKAAQTMVETPVQKNNQRLTQSAIWSAIPRPMRPANRHGVRRCGPSPCSPRCRRR